MLLTLVVIDIRKRQIPFEGQDKTDLTYPRLVTDAPGDLRIPLVGVSGQWQLSWFVVDWGSPSFGMGVARTGIERLLDLELGAPLVARDGRFNECWEGRNCYAGEGQDGSDDTMKHHDAFFFRAVSVVCLVSGKDEVDELRIRGSADTRHWVLVVWHALCFGRSASATSSYVY